jgi:hypothetical protein
VGTQTTGKIFRLVEEFIFSLRRGNFGAVSRVFLGVGHDALLVRPLNIDMKTTLIAFLGAAIIGCVTACASTPISPSTAGTVSAMPAHEGYLLVFTATQTVDADFHNYFDLHTGYDIDDTSGKPFKFVPNHDSDIDEAPDPVLLPSGTYTIVAKSVGGTVRFPLEVRSGEITTVRLDGYVLSHPKSSSARPVYLPNGEIVGWSAPM